MPTATCNACIGMSGNGSEPCTTHQDRNNTLTGRRVFQDL